MSVPGERVTWTQGIEVESGQITFSVTNGESSTWGSFGGEGNLTATLHWECHHDLDHYSPEVSAENSGVTFASHCVESLILKRVRVFREDGTIQTVELNYAVE